jgi:hypothetical protein
MVALQNSQASDDLTAGLCEGSNPKGESFGNHDRFYKMQPTGGQGHLHAMVGLDI